MQHETQSPEESLVNVINEIGGEDDDARESLYVVEQHSNIHIGIAVSGCAVREGRRREEWRRGMSEEGRSEGGREGRNREGGEREGRGYLALYIHVIITNTSNQDSLPPSLLPSFSPLLPPSPHGSS